MDILQPIHVRLPEVSLIETKQTHQKSLYSDCSFVIQSEGWFYTSVIGVSTGIIEPKQRDALQL